MKSTTLLSTVSKVSLYVLVVLIPFWVLPVTVNIVEYQKQALLVVLVLVGFISWIAKMVYGGEIRFRVSPLHILAGSVLLAVGISTIFSKWQYGSFWGWPLDVSDSFLTFFAFVLFYLFVSQRVKTTEQLLRVLGGFVLASTIAVAFAVVQMKEIFLIPFDFAQAIDFNTLGIANSVALFAAVLLPLSFVLASLGLASGGRGEAIWKLILRGSTMVLLISLALLDFFGAWIITIAGLSILLAFDLWSSREKTSSARISLPMVFILVSLFFLVFGSFSVPGAPVQQAQATPSYKGELAIAQGVLLENPLYGFIGTGPGTFVLDYAAHRAVKVNEGIFWSTRFSSGTSEILDWIITKGTLGLLALVGFAGFAVFSLTRMLLKPRKKKADDFSFPLGVGLLASFFAVVFSMSLYPGSFMIWFVFWILAGAIAFLGGREVRMPLGSAPSPVALGISLGLMLIVVFGTGLVFVGGQKYYAEIEYFRGLQAVRVGDEQQSIEKIQNAANLNSSVDLYWRDLSRLYLNRANQTVGSTTIPEDVRVQQAQSAVSSAVDAAQRAVEAGPMNVANWNVQGFVYRSLVGVPDADRLAIQSYEKSRELEPASPFPWTELGRVKILSAQAGNDESLEEAIADLNKAIELKPDYAPAHYLIAVAYDKQGNQSQAIAKLEETKLVALGDIGLAFQLGVIYYRQDELGKARDEFERAKLIDSRYANARYMLGLTYDRLGRKEEARVEFAAVGALNPDNQEVRDIQANLSAGLPALSGLGPQAAQPPIEDVPF
jgi:tetratricopeptide (TPR) repeat protein